jgi:hypothetical protein
MPRLPEAACYFFPHDLSLEKAMLFVAVREK